MTTVSDLVKVKGSTIWSINPDSSVYEALQLMAEKNVGALLVLESEKVVGIFSERDCARKAFLAGRSPRDISVREVMTAKVIGIGKDRSIDECMALMTEKRVRHLPVLDGEKLVGLISIGDVVKGVIADQKFTINLLEAYITGGR